MTPEQIKNSELDRLLRNAMMSDDNLVIPSGLSEKTMRRLEKKVILRNLILELSLKAGLVAVSLVVLTGVFIWFRGSDILSGLFSHIAANRQIIGMLLFAGFVIMLVDQVGVRFYNEFKKEQA
ncbi:MAG: hypothetical protein JXK95_13230 [Bacteroidales bacterium]|nr:hypothetical protein [Bacteroidales bacterium]